MRRAYYLCVYDKTDSILICSYHIHSQKKKKRRETHASMIFDVISARKIETQRRNQMCWKQEWTNSAGERLAVEADLIRSCIFLVILLCQWHIAHLVDAYRMPNHWRALCFCRHILCVSCWDIGKYKKILNYVCLNVRHAWHETHQCQ